MSERPCETRSIISRDGIGVVVVHSHGDEPEVHEVPGWAVQAIFALAGRDPEQEARKIDAAIERLQAERRRLALGDER